MTPVPRRRSMRGERQDRIDSLEAIESTIRSSRSQDWPDSDTTEATVIRHGVLQLRFADGLSSEVEVLDRMRGPVSR